MKQLFKRIVATLLAAEARMLLARKKPKIIAITGSVGKTSVKDAIYTVVKGRVHARKSEKSFNSELGVPLSVLGLQNAWSSPLGWIKNLIEGLVTALTAREYPEWLILEVGIDRPGDMARITQWLKPDVVVLTRLPDTPVHVEYFGSPEEVIAEKLKLVAALKEEGTLVYNHDDERVRAAAEGVRQQRLSFSRYSLSDFTASADKTVYADGRPAGLECTLTHDNQAAVLSVTGSLGVQHAYNYAAAAAVGSLLGVSIEDAAAALRAHQPPAGRMRLIEGIKETFLIDDTYNSSPAALERALQTLRELHGATRKIAVLGDMLELGQYSVLSHLAAGEQAAAAADVLITVGIRARGIAKGALNAGMDEERIFQYEDAARAGKELQLMLMKGDLVLVKGSQGVRLERIVEEVMAEPEKAEELLVRQEPMWKAR
jgi:UDP-N-acetylmuramyl pentapeptide synthase